MTIIAAAFDPTTHIAAMGSDSEMTRWGSVRLRSSPKLFRCGAALVGQAGYGMFREPIQSFEGLKAGSPPGDFIAWATALAEHIWAWGRERGHGHLEEGVWRQQCGLLLASSSGLLTIANNGEVEEVLEPFATAGSGMEIAYGAMAAGVRLDVRSPRRLVELGVAVACAHAPWCGGPVQIEEVSK